MVEQTAAPAEARVAPVETREAPFETRESPKMTEFADNFWGSTTASDTSNLSPNKFATRAGEPASGVLDFSVDDPLKAFRSDNQYSPASSMDGAIRTSHLRVPEMKERPVQGPVEDTRRLLSAITAMEKGDTSQLSQYVREMNDPSNPHRQKELQASMKIVTDHMNRYGVDAHLMSGNLSLTLPGREGKSLTIDSNGRVNLSGDALKAFGKKFFEHFTEKDSTPNLSDRMSRRLDGILDDLDRNDLRGLIGALKEIGDKVHSVKPGAAGELERKTAKELQGMLDALGGALSTNLVDARYDPQTGSFKITQPNRNGADQTLTIDKFGRASMRGADLNIFLFRMRVNQSRQPTVSV